MAEEKIQKSHRGKLDPNQPDVRPADQAEGERDGETSARVKRTPDQAEGEREDDSATARGKKR